MAYLGTKPANQVIDSTLIADGVITTADLANGAVNPAKLSTGAPSWDTNGNMSVGTTQTVSRATVAESVTGGEADLLVWNPSGSSGDRAALYLSAVATTVNLSRAAAIKASIGPANNHSLLFFTNSDYSDPVERMRIDSSGRVTTPFQPAFKARANGTSNITTGNTLPYSVADYNVGNHYSTSTYRFTAPIAGLYQFTIIAFFYPNTTGFFGYRVNGTVVERTEGQGWNGLYAQFSFTSTFYLNANDYVEPWVSNGTIHVNGNTAPASNWQGYLLG